MPILTTWGRLLRLPNLFTVPGDAFVGMAAGGLTIHPAAAGAAVAALLLLYSAGLLLNDFFDRKVDAAERPDRPIPSGAVKAGTVAIIGGLLLVGGIVLAWTGGGMPAGIAALVVAVLVLAYDGGGKRVPILGQSLMGACRAGAIALGWAASGTGLGLPSLMAMIVVGLYIMLVTVIAARECESGLPGLRVYLPAGLMVAAGGALPFFRGPGLGSICGGLVILLAGFGAMLAGRKVMQERLPVPPFIGYLLRSYIILQTALVMILWSEAGIISIIIIAGAGAALRLGAELASRKFYGS